ncbi:LysR family transcriptional regulator [Coralloluteibacterium stylophorae]|uniref:LysR family transcriptional regulator n=1 Tax=Coralloluteibacterium stylophorae TaxID=1776034 RepID=A0A8J7VS46_9GAMM|nr:LysR family transcriptional regulator [Coralloluteibacterium stylophorae]MBS7456907.1 LysR family transcriptional regulator [Coralloluteibacterium stylophorae]
MDRLDALRLFTRIVELGSFTRAAGELGLPRATATHAIKQLEARLQTRLLERTTRQVRTTADGQLYYERCVHVLAELEEAEGALREVAARPRGTLRVEMHGNHAACVVLPRLGEFHARYPDIEVVISSGDRLVDLVREGVDCAIRSGHPRDSSLVARPLATLREVVCASPGYLAEFGTPAHPDELARHRAVGFFAPGHDIDYPFEFVVDGRRRTVDVGGWLKVNDARSYVAAALHGHGLIQIPPIGVEKYLQDGRLVEVLEAFPAPGVPVSVLTPRHRQPAPRVRLFVDWVAGVYAERFGRPA